MNEDRKKRGLANSKFLTAVAISALFLGSGNAMATQTNTDSSLGVTEQLQTLTVSGLVVDASGEPVIGASVVEKGTTNGSITDTNGKFTLSVKPGATLKISYVGYQTQETKASRTMKIVLKEDSELLSEVVVVGYGVQKKENLTGAVASVDVNKTLEGRPIADVGRGLQGTTPGLSIVVPSGEVGSDPTIKIRGQIGSIDGGSEPLILLDNVEIPSIQMVNPDDIESISILKDAASASIYGAKAAFGVVLITSKKGAKQETINVSYSGNFSWQNISKKMEMAGIDGLDYTVNAFERVGGTKAGAFWLVDRTSFERAKEWQQKWGGKIGPNDPFVYGRDWYYGSDKGKYSMRTFDPYDYMIEEWTPAMTHNLSVNGKSGKTTFNIGLGYLSQDGLMKTAKKDDFRRWNASVKISTEFNKYVTLRAGAIYSKRDKRYAYATSSVTADPWLYLYRWGPTVPMGYNEDGQELRSPASETRQANTANIENSYANINIGATLNITKDWKFDIDYTYANEQEINNRPGTRYTAANTWGAATEKKDAAGNQIYVDENGNTVAADAAGAMPAYALSYFEYTSSGANPDHIYRKTTNANRNTLNINTNYNWQINDNNNLKAMLGMNRVTWDQKYNWNQTTKLMDLENPQYDLAYGTQTGSGGSAWDGQLGFYGRLNYNLMDKYLLEANLRYDGTSKFPSDLQWRWFPSFSLGWRASEEAFMQWAKPALSSLKFRGSWGTIGDQTVSNKLYVSTMGTGQSAWIGGDGSKVGYVGTPSAIIPSITWQDITTLDIGMDARFINGELGVTFDWYQRDTKNMIVPIGNVSLAFGADSPKGNFGSLRTRGWEIALDYNHRFKNGLGINAMFTLSDAITEITAYGDTKSLDSWYVGKQYGEIWGYETERLYQKDDFLYNPDGSFQKVWLKGGEVYDVKTAGAKEMNKLSDPKAAYQDYLQGGDFVFGPGDVKYKDLNGDGSINDGSRTTDDHGDLKKIGNSTPRYEYGFRLGADYKGFDVSVFFQGVGKREVWGAGFLAIPGYNSADGAMPQAIAGNFWKEDRTDAFYPRAWNLGAPGLGDSGYSYNMQKQSRYLLDMSYLRIKNITVGYTLPKDLLKKVWIQKARIYFALENFVTWDNLNGLPIDPEEVSGYSMFADNDAKDNYNSGRTGVGTPTFKSMSVGIQLNF